METPEQESPAPEGVEESSGPAAEDAAHQRPAELLPDIPVEEAEEGAPVLPPRVFASEPVLARPIHVEQGLLSLDQLDADEAFRLRPEGDVSRLAQDVARLGQVFPVDVRLRGDRFQLVCGFRRVAALRFLQRDKVLARIHTELSDDDALLVALADALVVVAGMEGALPSVVGGMVAAPVIAVPTSTGYGSSFGGLTALLAMLNSCASNVTVVNIDNGFGAGYVASLINRL